MNRRPAHGAPRRAVLAGGASALLVGGSASAAETFAALEKGVGGRLGVCAVDTGTGKRLTHRAAERFAMCSTFKTALAAAILSRVAAGQERLDRIVPYGQADMRSHAPVTEKHLGGRGLSVETLCQAVVEVSDNPAANLLLKTLGGPERFTAYLRTLGDTASRLDRWETELNTAIAGDPRDTTTPEAMAANLQALLLGEALIPAHRDRLIAWMAGSPTGVRRLRKDLPSGWRAGDKTGTGANGATNDIAVFWPAAGAPIVVAAYLTETAAPLAAREAVLAKVGRMVADTFRPGAA